MPCCSIGGVSYDGRVFFWKTNAVAAPFKEVRLNFTSTSTMALAMCKLEVSNSHMIHLGMTDSLILFS